MSSSFENLDIEDGVTVLASFAPPLSSNVTMRPLDARVCSPRSTHDKEKDPPAWVSPLSSQRILRPRPDVLTKKRPNHVDSLEKHNVGDVAKKRIHVEERNSTHEESRPKENRSNLPENEDRIRNAQREIKDFFDQIDSTTLEEASVESIRQAALDSTDVLHVESSVLEQEDEPLDDIELRLTYPEIADEYDEYISTVKDHIDDPMCFLEFLAAKRDSGVILQPILNL